MKKRCEYLHIKPLLAVKGFPLALVYHEISSYLCGTSASGLFETLLGAYLGKENHIHAPAYREDEIEKILNHCDHIVFNSYSQWERYREIVKKKIPYVSPGLRINPEYSEVSVDKYNTCLPNSRFGLTHKELSKHDISEIDGLHLHVMCEQGAETLLNVINVVREKFCNYLHSVKWINLGGGHQLANSDYNYEILREPLLKLMSDFNIQIYVEPCEAVVENCGYLITTVLDVVENGKKTAILDTSACCHMPGILEMPYVPDIVFPPTSEKKQFNYILSGVSCMAGDIIGEYQLDKELKVGDKIIFSNMGAYSFARENYFNGINYPSIALFDKNNGLRVVKSFSYSDYLKNYY